MDATEKQEITDLVREAVGEAVSPLARRVESIENKVDKTAAELHEVREHVRTLAEADVKFAQQMTQVAGAAAHAADLGLKAMTRAGEAEDTAAKIVQSAMTIHNASIATSVEATVTKAVEPLAAKFSQLETNDKKHDETLEAQNATLDDIKKAVGTIAKALGHPHLRKAIIVAALLGAAIGGGVAGYTAVTGKDAVKQLLP